MASVDCYWGAASFSAKKALKRLGVDRVMISYATMANQPWDGISDLFIDCGGYSMLKSGKEHPPRERYAGYLQAVKPDLWALPDYPCEPDLLDDYGRTVRDHQNLTTEAHREMIDKDCPGDPVAVVQGWTPAEYERHAQELIDHGLLTETVGVGSVCRRNAEQSIEEVIKTVRDVVGQSVHLHGFGVKTSILQRPEARAALDSVDTDSYEYRGHRRPGLDSVPQYQKYMYHLLSMKAEIEEAKPGHPNQTTLAEVAGGNT